MKQRAHIFSVWTVVFILLGILFAGMGFYKIYVYEGSEHSWSKPQNAYVGGDAYNYIINGTYFAGYSALSGAMFICACICGVYKSKAEGLNELLETQEEIKQTLKIGYAEDINREKEKQEEIKRVRMAQEERERQKRAEAQRKAEKQRQAAQVAKQVRIAAYWDSHPDEKKALAEKRITAEKKLNELGKFAVEQRKALEDLIQAIDKEFEKDRED